MKGWKGKMKEKIFDLYRGRYTCETITADHAAANRCNIPGCISISAYLYCLPSTRHAETDKHTILESLEGCTDQAGIK